MYFYTNGTSTSREDARRFYQMLQHTSTHSNNIKMDEQPAITNDANKENRQPNEPPPARSARSLKKKVASFPEGECYELLLMDIVDRNSAHLPPRGAKGKLWTKVVADLMQPQGQIFAN